MSKVQTRPPIIVIMGHVDHGKTTLMDYIQHTDIAAKEKGGITQTIRAFQVSYKDQLLTFVDTPGHEAFAKMRERGSQFADIILLVVAADDGVKPQTKEVIDLALRDNITLVVAINKTDLPGSDVNKVKNELAQAGVLLEGWGGDTIAVEISAKNGTGVDTLLDMLVLVSELAELKMDERKNKAVVLESYQQKGTGPETLMIVLSGKISLGDYVAGEEVYGKIRAIRNDHGDRIDEATSSMPIRVLGLESVLPSGEQVFMSKDKSSLLMSTQAAQATTSGPTEETLDFFAALSKQSQEDKTTPRLNIVLKADYVGSIEAITASLEAAKTKGVEIHIIQSNTGEVTESDVLFAKSTRSIIIGFNVSASPRVRLLTQNENVILMQYSIIYELIDDVLSAAESLIIPESREVAVGSSSIIDVFTLSNGNVVGGGIVQDGRIVRGYACYVMRGKERVYEGKVLSIRHLKEEIKDAVKGVDCGIIVQPNFAFAKNDVLTCIRIEKS